MNDPRIKIVVLILLSISHSIVSQYAVMVMVALTVFIVCIHLQALMRGLWIILLSYFAIAVLGTIAWSYSSDLQITYLIIDYIRWCSLIALTVVLILSLSALDIVSSLVFFRIPYPFALSIGIGLRFLPILQEEALRTAHYQKRRGMTPSIVMVWKYGLIDSISKVISPILVGVIRRVDTLTLSIVMQQLERRIRNKRFERATKIDWLVLVISTCLTVLCLMNIYK